MDNIKKSTQLRVDKNDMVFLYCAIVENTHVNFW